MKLWFESGFDSKSYDVKTLCFNVSGFSQPEKRILGKVAETWSLYQTGKDLMYHVYRNCIFLIFRIPFMNVSYFQDYDNKYPSCQTSELPVTYVFWFLKNIDLYSWFFFSMENFSSFFCEVCRPPELSPSFLPSALCQPLTPKGTSCIWFVRSRNSSMTLFSVYLSTIPATFFQVYPWYPQIFKFSILFSNALVDLTNSSLFSSY